MKNILLFSAVLLVTLTARSQCNDPYAVFGHTSKVSYENKIKDFLYIKNTDKSSDIKAVALDGGNKVVYILGVNDSIMQSLPLPANEQFRWISVDPKADKYPSLSPYNYVANNPLNAIDPNGKDIVVLNNPNGAGGYGHMAVMIGSNKTGWTFFSKEGRNKEPWYSNELTGGPALTPLIRTFTSYEAFQEVQKTDNKLGGYTQNVRFETTKEQDNKAQAATTKSANSWYQFLTSNCADAVSDGLKAAGLNPGAQSSSVSLDDSPFSTGKELYSLNPQPTIRFMDIIKANKTHIIPITPPPATTNGTTTPE